MNDTERQPVETEEIVVNDTPVIVEQSVNDTITVKIPSDLSDEAKEELRKSIEEGNVSKLVAAWNRKNQLKNEEMAEIERIKAELTAPPKTEEKPKQETSTQTPLWKRLNLKSEADLEDWAIDHPEEYHREIARDTAEQQIAEHRAQLEKEWDARLAQLKQEQTRTQTQAQITASGYDPLEVEAFARMYGVTDLGKAFTLYQRVHQDKSDPVLRAQKEAQSKQINFIEQQHYRRKTAPTAEEIASMTDEELAEWAEAAKELAIRES